MRRIALISAFMALFLPFSSVAEERISPLGETALLNAVLPRDPVDAALGGTGATSTENVAFAALTNPSAIPFSTNSIDFAVAYGRWNPSSPAGSHNVNTGFAYNISNKFGLALSVATDIYSPYDINDETGYSRNSFSPSDMLVAGSFSWRFIENAAFGVNAAYLLNNLYDNLTYGSPSFGFFASMKLQNTFISAGIRNIGPAVDGKYPLPTDVYAAFSFSAGDKDASSFDVRASADWYMYGMPGISAGIEYSYASLVAARIGYHYSGDTPLFDCLSFGVALKFAFVRLDAAYIVAMTPDSGSFCVGIGIQF